MSPPNLFVEALLLRKTPYGESDVVATLLTPAMGRVGALARGARSSKKRFGGALDFFNVFRAEISQSRGGMLKLLGVELVRSYGGIMTDVDRFAAGGHFLEIARLGTREDDPSPEFFHLLQSALEALNAGCDEKSLVRVFQARWLAAMGYGLGAADCAGCGAPLGEGGATFHDFAPVCAPCGEEAQPGWMARHPLSAGAAKTLRAAQALDPARLGALRISPALLAELAPLLDGALARALGVAPKTTGTLAI